MYMFIQDFLSSLESLATIFIFGEAFNEEVFATAEGLRLIHSTSHTVNEDDLALVKQNIALGGYNTYLRE